MLKFRSIALAACAVAMTWCVGASAQAVSAEDQVLADTGKKVGKSFRRKFAFRDRHPRVVIIPFPFSDKIEANLSTANEFEIGNVDELVQLCKEQEVSPAHFTSPFVALWAARRLKADAVILGGVEAKADHIELRIMALTTRGEEVEDIRVKLEKSARMVGDLQDWRSPIAVPVVDVSAETSPVERGVQHAGKDGVKIPKCPRCPSPRFTDDATVARYSGTVYLRIVSDEQGRVTSVMPVRRGPFGLTERAMETVRTWTLEPAKKDGKPIPVMMIVEVSFKTHE